MSTTPARLITITFSHYCEKARWALDHTRVPYVEEGHLPGFHLRPARRAGGRSVPVLVTGEKTLTESDTIVAYCDALAAHDRKLYPRDASARREVEAIEAICNGELGLASRLFVYHHALPNPRALAETARPGLTKWQAWLMPHLLPIVGMRIRRMYRIEEDTAVKAAETMRRRFAELSAQLEGKRFFVGDAFTAADLAFASLTAPILCPEGHPATTGSVAHVEGPLRAMIEELRATRAGKHAQTMYRDHRRLRTETSHKKA
jgi:glutathione S-transferase